MHISPGNGNELTSVPLLDIGGRNTEEGTPPDTAHQIGSQLIGSTTTPKPPVSILLFHLCLISWLFVGRFVSCSGSADRQWLSVLGGRALHLTPYLTLSMECPLISCPAARIIPLFSWLGTQYIIKYLKYRTPRVEVSQKGWLWMAGSDNPVSGLSTYFV